ncbi:hypothetical protein AHMF7605_00205 [Adhaeribacter arboris]|uniref:Uncharacterized protein n=1 Tax=Adhaeribacter arboris TaxID=2072846 RepID=A0A2T2Y955_9BACT|nr:hypothetical protein AHMF7605_00205 [Adhaeribacter arboris]
METTQVLKTTNPVRNSYPAEEQEWTEIIEPRSRLLNLGLMYMHLSVVIFNLVRFLFQFSLFFNDIRFYQSF